MATRVLPIPLNETKNSVSRITREGKKITYCLDVIQQPVRARACGQGQKSHADRRPVDPPPVVEMRIFESDPRDEQTRTEITFVYNANFFLFTTLETSAPMTQGRVQASDAPVLTGVPVAGVAYLDKPQKAGYFIFPDLSVRNEGKYRLSFHLFEHVKDPKYATEGQQQPIASPVPGKIPGPQQHLDFRLDVVTVPFEVFSAKKFPGLGKSTQLSRDFAEQGCRVRIRREVRMRRRADGKPAETHDYDKERAYRERAERYATPDAYGNAPERPRSTSVSTVHPYISRRPSAVDYPHQIPQPYQRPMPPTPGQSSTPIPHPIAAPPHAAVPSAMFSPAPSHPHAHAPAIPSAPIAGPPPLHTPSYQSQSHMSHLSFGSAQPQYSAPPHSHVPQPLATPTRMYSPRPSISHGQNPSICSEYEPSMGYPYSNSRLQAERSSYPKPPQQNSLPPLPSISSLTPPVEPHHPQEAPGITRPQTPIPSLPPITMIGEFPAPTSQPSSSIASSPGIDYGPVKPLYEINQALSKRTHEESFGHDDRPLYNGMRPDTESYPGGSYRRPSYERAPYAPGPEMAYKRANGRLVTKPATMH